MDDNKKFINFIFTRNGIIYPANLNGHPINKLSDKIEIRNFNDLTKWKNRNIRRFIFRPVSAGLIGIDLDRKSGRDGISELQNIIGDLPSAYPRTITPSDGRHIYFLSDNRDYVSCELRDRPGIEIKYRALLTLPGSVKDYGQYEFIGNPAEIQTIPEALKTILPVIQPQEQANRRPQPFKQNSLSLDKISNILEKQGTHPINGNRNHYAFSFSKYARKQGYDPDDIKNYLSFLIDQDFTDREISATVRSAYRGGYNV